MTSPAKLQTPQKRGRSNPHLPYTPSRTFLDRHGYGCDHVHVHVHDYDHDHGNSPHVTSKTDGWADQVPASATLTEPQRYKFRLRRRDSLGSAAAAPAVIETPSRRKKRDWSTDWSTAFNNDDTTAPVASDKESVGALGIGRRRQNQFYRFTSSGHRQSPSMSSSGGKWREEQILIICPGSRTTMAQLGCSELTPPTHRIPTRMFQDGNEWRPYYTFKRTKKVNGIEQEEWVEDIDEDKGAVWPIEGGRIVHMEAFLAFLDHVHSLLTTTYHNTPIMLMASPQWTRPDCEAIAQYIFEKTRTPALCLIHSAIATQYGLKFPNMTIVDIGYEKVDVTAIHDGRVVNHMDIGAPNGDRVISGGEAFTQRLMKLLQPQNFTHDMAEQLKKSVICEVLPYAGAESLLVELPVEGAAPAAASIAEPVPDAPAEPKEAPKLSEMNGDEGEAGEGNGDDDGVLDVATIVTSGQTKEFLAKKEKEKGKPGRKPKDKEADAAQAKPGRLPNSKRVRNSFVFEEVVQEEVVVEPKKDVLATNGGAPQQTLPAEGGEVKENPPPPAQPDAAPAEAAAAAAPEAATVTAPTEPSVEAAVEPTPEVKPETVQPPAVVQVEPPQAETTEHRTKRVRRDIEVGLERFTFADREEIDRIVSTIYRTVQGIEDMYMRPPCWDNLVFVGNGSRLRGLKENILQTLNARHLVSPSTATMFTSELPSNMATPTGTGSQTPTGSFTGAPHQLSTSGVNPLLQAATTASTLGAAAAAGGAAPPNSVTLATPQAGSETGGPVASHFHSQTPTSIKTASLPTYLQEWSKNGFEESMFLGAQVAARIVFCLHSNMDAQGVEAQRLASLSRVDYNELGPKGIRTHSMLS